MGYPEDAGTITPLVDGTDYMEDDNVNDVVDELEAAKMLIGIPGAAQSHLATILDMLADNYTGGRCYGEDGTVDEVYVGVFAGIISNAAGSIRKPRRITTVTTLTATDLDTGAMAVGYYYIYATADTAIATPVFVFSASDTTPTGYTNYKKIGKFYNETISVLDILPEKVGSEGDSCFGEWATKVNDTVYLAETDGFVVMRSLNINGDIAGFTDSSNPPTTERAHSDIDSNNVSLNFMMPVRKSDYWKVTSTGTYQVYWLPRFGA